MKTENNFPVCSRRFDNQQGSKIDDDVPISSAISNDSPEVWVCWQKLVFGFVAQQLVKVGKNDDNNNNYNNVNERTFSVDWNWNWIIEIDRDDAKAKFVAPTRNYELGSDPAPLL